MSRPVPRGAPGAAAYAGVTVVVAGAGVSGLAAARVLVGEGARVRVADSSSDRLQALAAELPGVAVQLLGPEAVGPVLEGADLVVTSPGWRPDHPLLAAAVARGTEVIGEVELAWRLAQADARTTGAPAAPWLAVTGTNGKTTTVRMLAAILSAAGLRTVATGNVGLALLDAVRPGASKDADPYDVLAVELSSFQLHWSSTLDPHTATVLNLAPDHVDWHGSFDAYGLAKGRIHGPTTRPVVNGDDPAAAALAPARAELVGFTLQAPREGELGVVEDLLVDRAFTGPGDTPGEATVLVELADLQVPGAHNVANALAAAALARSYGVSAEAVRAGLSAFRPDPHRNAVVASSGGIDWVDDSKATNPHAAAASLAAYASIVWVAGGLLKGADVDALVAGAAHRLRAVVLLGTDQQPFVDALARHAPSIPVRRVDRLDTGAMSVALAHARDFAAPGDTVLLAPAAASMDCFRDYRERGDLFAREAGR